MNVTARQSVKHRFVIAGARALCAFLMVAGVLIALAGLRDWKRGSAIAHWPTVEAEVVSLRLVKRVFPPTRYSSSRESYTREMGLRYTINGSDYTSNLVVPAEAPDSPAENPSSDPILSAGPGSRLTVHYDPADPRTAIVHPASARQASLTIAIGIVLTVGASAFIAVLRSQKA